MDYLLEIIKEHLGAAFVVAVLLCSAIIMGIAWAVRQSYKWRKYMDDTDGRLNNLPCNSHQTDICKHDARLESVTTSLARIEGSLETLILLYPQSIPARRGSILSSDEPELSQKNSPKRLNDNGEKVFDAFHCADFLSRNSEWLMAEVEKFKPKTALDVESMSLAALRVASGDDRFNELKNLIYHSPGITMSLPNGEARSIDISLDDVLFVMSLPLRDMYLSSHSDLLK